MDFRPFLDAAAKHFNDERHLIPMYIHLIISALFPIYAGAHASLSCPASAAKPTKKEKRADAEDDEDEEVVQKMEGMSPKDAVIYPVIAGITLAGLYYLITKYGARAINLIFGWYFAVAGVFSVAKLIGDAATVAISLVFPTYFGWKGKLYKVDSSERKAVAQGSGNTERWIMPAPFLPVGSKTFFDAIWAVRAAIKQRYTVSMRTGYNSIDEKTNITIIHVVSAILGVAASLYANLVSKPWYLTNLQGFAVCYTAFQLLSPTSFTTGSLLLAGLFCYDIWAVFFTPLMVTVAKNLDQPIKLVFPRPEEVVQPTQIPFVPHKMSEVTGKATRQYSMLGLGDIVLPGIMIALALRFDLHLFYLAKQRKVMRKTAAAADDDAEKEEEGTEKAPYVPITGNYGDRFWTARLPASARPEKLNASFPKPHFYASMIGYVVGMLATLVVMSVYQHAQPALLYLVPGVLISLWGTALARGEIRHMWNFSEAVDGEPVEDGDEMAKEEQPAQAQAQSWQDMWKDLLCLIGLWEKKEESKEGDKAASEKSVVDEKAKKAKDGEKTDSEDDSVLFSFSISRYDPAAKGKVSVSLSGTPDASSGRDMTEKMHESRNDYEASSEDVVLVESQDT